MYLELCTREQLIGIFAEFGATEETVREDVLKLKDWLKTQSHLPNIEGKVPQFHH